MSTSKCKQGFWSVREGPWFRSLLWISSCIIAQHIFVFSAFQFISSLNHSLRNEISVERDIQNLFSHLFTYLLQEKT